MKFFCSVLVLLTFLPLCYSQTPDFHRGVNLTGWFQKGAAGQVQFTRYTRKDFEQIKSLGCDVIRLPINLHFMTSGSPHYTLDPLFLFMLDQVVSWASELEIYLILDNHTFDPNEATTPAVEPILITVWSQMAAHFKDASRFILYEVLNEPHGISDALWNGIQKNVIAAIREHDPSHYIVVGGSGYNSYNNLQAIPDLGDDRLIYTFHFYDPFLFTHQGASWVTPSMAPLRDIPFPYRAGAMPSLPASLAGSWVNWTYNSYPQEGNEQKVRELIDIAVKFRDERNVPVFCGEFGVFIPNSDREDRRYWYQIVREYLEDQNIPWTMWDYHGGFGLFEQGGHDLFEHDLNVPLLEALEFNIPDQTPYVKQPDNAGFIIYDDYIGPGLFENGYGGLQNYYHEDQPHYGKYCIRWSEADQYNTIGFNFSPNRDLSFLVDQEYSLDLFVRSEISNLSFDLRFLDSDTGDQDHAWRMRHIVDANQVTWDGSWQHLHIPLKEFVEHGAWEGEWFPPEGKFDWTKVDRFEISTEYVPIGNNGLLIDQIVITNQDTAMVITGDFRSDEDRHLEIFPNPSAEWLYLKSPTNHLLDFTIRDLTGKVYSHGVSDSDGPITIQGFPSGMYLLTATSGKYMFNIPFVKID